MNIITFYFSMLISVNPMKLIDATQILTLWAFIGGYMACPTNRQVSILVVKLTYKAV